MPITWIATLKKYNSNQPDWCIQRKGTKDHSMVRKLMTGEKMPPEWDTTDDEEEEEQEGGRNAPPPPRLGRIRQQRLRAQLEELNEELEDLDDEFQGSTHYAEMYANPELFIDENSPLSPTQEELNGLTEAEYYEELHSHHTERVRDIPNEITEINNQMQELETELYALQDAEEQGGQGKKFDKFKSLFKKKKTKSEADELTEFADVVHNTEGLFTGRNAQSLETEKLIMSMLPRQKDNVLEAKEKKYKELDDRLYFLAQRRNRNNWINETIRARASKYKRYLNTNRINDNHPLFTHYDRSLVYKLEREYDKIVEDVENQRRDVKRTMREIENSKPRDEIYRI